MPFSLDLSDADRTYCRELIRWSIRAVLEGRSGFDGIPDPPSDILRENLGAFVTLKIDGSLRGCIGNIVGQGPLFETLARMARAAAFEDPRFAPLTETEFDRVDTEISVLSPVEECPDPEAVVIGRHGLIVMRGTNQGLLLPQVAVEWGWDRETFLAQTCRKAGLPPNAWKEAGTRLLWFEAVVF